MNLRLTLSGSVFFLFGLIVLSACKKDPVSGTVNISMEAEPAPYYEVNVFVKEIWAHYATDESNTNWEQLSIRKGFYNLLDLGILGDTIIAQSAALPEGQLTQLRFVLESDSCHLIELGDSDFTRVPTPLASTQFTGLKITTNSPIKGSTIMNLRLNFDTGNSISLDDEGGYILDPIITVDTVAYVE